MPSRRTVTRLTFVPVAALAVTVFACSSQAPEGEHAAETQEGVVILKCSSTTVPYCTTFDGPNGRPMTSCDCEDWVIPDTDTCGDQDIPPPAALPNCKVGAWIGSPGVPGKEPVWACPISYKGNLPPTLGLVGDGGLSACAADAGGDPINCEKVIWVDGFDSPCIPPPADGWGYVWDHEPSTCCYHDRDSGSGCGGGCPGPCALHPQPPTN